MGRSINIIQLIILCVSTITYSQQILTDLTDNAIKDVGQINSIFDLNVFEYNNLYEEYDTELKQEIFKKTEQYKNLLSELKIKKGELTEKLYYTIKQEEFSEIDYNIKKKGFEIIISTNTGLGTLSTRTPKSICLQNGENILLKSLPTFKKPSSNLVKGVFEEILFLEITEEDGLEIENNRDDIQLYYFFTPTKKEKSSFKYFNYDTGRFNGWYTLNNIDIISEIVQIVVANKITGKIYYNKTFHYQPKKK
jgi:hypothetical protein